MLITRIKKLRSGRYGVYGDYRFLVSVDEEILVRRNLAEGREIDDGQIQAIVEESVSSMAKDKALSLLSYRDHSKAELKNKLVRTVGEAAAWDAADKMEELGLVNDADYAAKLARELFNKKFYGSARVTYEMLHRGIDREIVEAAVEELEIDPVEQILKFLRRRYPAGISDEKNRKRASAALMRNGFQWDEIRQAFREYERI
ncbi:MAG TPA: regulatory protein RecX [Clostridia bacterium]|nr:regulatory protein RecX [Clostridia bacterium]